MFPWFAFVLFAGVRFDPSERDELHGKTESWEADPVKGANQKNLEEGNERLQTWQCLLV